MEEDVQLLEVVSRHFVGSMMALFSKDNEVRGLLVPDGRVIVQQCVEVPECYFLLTRIIRRKLLILLEDSGTGLTVLSQRVEEDHLNPFLASHEFTQSLPHHCERLCALLFLWDWF